MNCTTQYADPLLIKWLKNGVVVSNSSSHVISHQRSSGDHDVYHNTLTVKGAEHSKTNITCSVFPDNEEMNISLQGHIVLHT